MVLEEPDLALPAAGEPASPKKKEVAAWPGPGSQKKEVAALGRPAGAEFAATSFLFDEKRVIHLNLVEVRRNCKRKQNE